MALASKDRNPNLLHHQPYTFYGTKSCNDYEIGGDGISEKMDKSVAAGGSSNSSTSLSCSLSTGTNSMVYQAAKNYHHHPPEESRSLISFKPGYINEFAQTSSTGCLLSFEENNENPYSILDHMSQMKANSSIDDNIGLLDSFMNSSVQTASSAVNYGLVTSHGGIEEGDLELDSFGWANPQAAHDPHHHNNIQQVLGAPESSIHKRPHTGSESEQVNKKQCTTSSNGSTKKAKPKSTQCKDPQSIAAKNRRERISERLKVLQDLVPNGSKVDLVTMLEKAIGYVKFLQLQVKVLATDEFWPMQGGKPPELSQVREAIDAILSSTQIDRNSSNSK